MVVSNNCLGKLISYPQMMAILLLIILNVSLSSSTTIYYSKQGTESSPPECLRDEYSHKINETTTVCQPCTTCQPGEGARHLCSAYRDTVCVKCKAGRKYSMEINGVEKCQRCSHCHKANRIVKKRCTPTSDTVCGACKEGHYYDALSMKCQPCSRCVEKLLIEGLIFRLSECSDIPEMQCSVNYEFQIQDVESTGGLSKPMEDPIPEEDVPFEKVKTVSKNVEPQPDDNPATPETTCHQNMTLFYVSVAFFVISSCFFAAAMVTCCAKKRHKKTKKRSPIYRRPRTPVEGSQGSLDS